MPCSRLLATRRCVVLINGFYEWKQEGSSRKQPYFVSFGEDNVMKLAGLYDVWKGDLTSTHG
jgi:putative SOS response-associated peptidase YedK